MLATARIWFMPYVYDDADWIAHSAADGWAIATAPFRVFAEVSHGSPWGPHAGVLTLHLLNGVLLWRLARRWLSEIAALCALTCFWLHPLSLQAVFYVTGGREAWLTLFVLIALLGGCSISLLGWIIGVLALAAAVFVKGSALPVAVAVPMVWATVRGHGRLCAVLLVLVGLSTSGPWQWSLEALRAWAVGLSWYLAALVWPMDFAIIHDWRAPVSVGFWTVAAIVAIGVGAWRWSRPTWYVWLWIVGLTIPRAMISDAPPLADAHLYLPALATWIGAGVALDASLMKGSIHG